MNTKPGGSSATLENEIENPGLRGDKSATTCVSHCAALGTFQCVEIIMTEGERFSINNVDSTVLGMLTLRRPIGISV
jgi:hypothetical protein